MWGLLVSESTLFCFSSPTHLPQHFSFSPTRFYSTGAVPILSSCDGTSPLPLISSSSAILPILSSGCSQSHLLRRPCLSSLTNVVVCSPHPLLLQLLPRSRGCWTWFISGQPRFVMARHDLWLPKFHSCWHRLNWWWPSSSPSIVCRGRVGGEPRRGGARGFVVAAEQGGQPLLADKRQVKHSLNKMVDWGRGGLPFLWEMTGWFLRGLDFFSPYWEWSWPLGGLLEHLKSPKQQFFLIGGEKVGLVEMLYYKALFRTRKTWFVWEWSASCNDLLPAKFLWNALSS